MIIKENLKRKAIVIEELNKEDLKRIKTLILEQQNKARDGAKVIVNSDPNS